jgi:2-polyprenyl-3-methyl-5-hydroxy-6-metoxy-1,4-benzoquinol methylase
MEWNDAAEGWDDDPAVKTYAAAAFARLKSLSADLGAPLEGSRVLDFGCGSGLLTERLAPLAASLVALDPADAMLAHVRRKKAAHRWDHVTLVLGTLEDLAERGFDWIVCSSVLAFVDDYQATVAGLAALLSPGGRLVAFDWELNPDDEEPYGLSRSQIDEAYRAAGLVEIVVETGFEAPYEGMTMAPLLGVGRRA